MSSRSTILVLAGVCAAISLLPQSAAAQSAQKWSLQGSALAVVPGGTAYDGLASGFGIEAQVRYTPSAFSLGGGYQASFHDLDLGDGTVETVTLAGGFLEPRYVIDVRSARVAPYLSARLAVLTQTVTVEGFDLSATGTQINGGGGILVRMGSRVNLDLGLTLGAIQFDDVQVRAGGETVVVTGSSGNGTNFVLRIGAAIGLGK
ncbi:MAG: outer membrane beta-barrel protein [Gemmatimonadota bacterium]|nr:outer membrane beta-barrel protein [Gemmatimonadota bacterium]